MSKNIEQMFKKYKLDEEVVKGLSQAFEILSPLQNLELIACRISKNQ